MMQRVFTFLAVFFVTGPIFAGACFADACSDCQTQKRVVCASKCDSSPDRASYDRCLRQCIDPGCTTKCKNNTPTNASSLETAEAGCQKCLMTILGEGCLDICDRMSPSYDRCRKSCAKQKCASKCTLPDAGFHNAPPKAKYACQQCKASAEISCRASSMCSNGEPGSIACEFHCVAESCREDCSEEVEGVDD